MNGCFDCLAPRAALHVGHWLRRLLGLALLCAAGAAASAQAIQEKALPPEIDLIPDSTGKVGIRWADKVLGFSSEGGPKVFAAKQVLGKPDKLPATGISAVAWMPNMRYRLPEEWVKVGFARPRPASQVLVGESARPGAIEKIYVFDRDNRAQMVFERADTAALPVGAVRENGYLQVRFPLTDYDIAAVLVVLKATDSIAIHQLDAIGLTLDHEPVLPGIRQLVLPEGSGQAENLGPMVNSFFDEVFPVISPDGQTLYFDRKNHPANLGSVNHDDIWLSERSVQEDSSGHWGMAQNAGKPLNNGQHNFVCSISPDGNTLLLGNAYQDDGRLTSGMSLSHRTLEGWSYPEPVEILDYYNRDEFGEFQLASNGKVILMAIERDDSEGKRDLYASFRMHDGRWSAPLHLGPDVNSAGLEMSPFLAPDMRTLYFSSNGFPGFGSNDMFMSRRLDESWTRWSEPMNLGPTLNSGEMDAYYTLPASGDYAYFASANRSIGRTDLFRVAMPADLQPEPVVLVRGRVLDAISGEPLAGEIRYLLSQGPPTADSPAGLAEGAGATAGSTTADSLAGLARSAPEDGAYQVVLPYGERYRMEASLPGYFALQESLDLSQVQEYGEQTRDLLLIPLKRGQVVPMREIFFAVNSDSLLPDSYPELDRVLDLLQRYPALRIEIGGHTNDRCSENYCRELSRKRARSVARYLYKRGLDTERVRWVGYGKEQPIADNETEEGRSRNQRVEFKVLEFAE
ncbi:MAG: OmpA family protein [Bacteroidetes bacterium]|nr:OmpA family protein [Bacteroidota bacterium]